jgi:hypothetical protein
VHARTPPPRVDTTGLPHQAPEAGQHVMNSRPEVFSGWKGRIFFLRRRRVAILGFGGKAGSVARWVRVLCHRGVATNAVSWPMDGTFPPDLQWRMREWVVGDSERR